MWNTNGGDRHAGRGWEKEMDRVASHPAVCREAANADCVGPSKPPPPHPSNHRRQEEGSRVNRRIFAPAAQKLHKVVLKRCSAFQVFRGRRVLSRLCRDQTAVRRKWQQWHAAKQSLVALAPVQWGWKGTLTIHEAAIEQIGKVKWLYFLNGVPHCTMLAPF